MMVDVLVVVVVVYHKRVHFVVADAVFAGDEFDYH